MPIWLIIVIIVVILLYIVGAIETYNEEKNIKKHGYFYKTNDDDLYDIANNNNHPQSANAAFEFYERYVFKETKFAFHWLLNAAKKGHPKACYIVATDYLDGGFYDFENSCMFMFDEHSDCFIGKPSKQKIRRWLECAKNGGINIDKKYLDKLNNYR